MKTNKKEKRNQLKLQKRTVEMSLFIKIKMIPTVQHGSCGTGGYLLGNFPPPLDHGRTVNFITIKGTDYMPLPPIFRASVGSVQDIYLCKCL